jgi:hypothetical protein
VPKVVFDPSGTMRAMKRSASSGFPGFAFVAWIGLFTGKSADAVCPTIQACPVGSIATIAQYSLEEPPTYVEYSSAFPAALSLLRVESSPPPRVVSKAPAVVGKSAEVVVVDT